MNYKVRPATVADADAIAEAHMDSIHTLGARFYDAAVIAEWGKPRDGTPYRNSMERGELNFIAVPDPEPDTPYVYGFSFYSRRIPDGAHQAGVYVRGTASGQGIAQALYEAAEAAARKENAPELVLDSSLGAVKFYTAMGYEKIADGQHQLKNGASMACIHMRKLLKVQP